MSSDTPTVQQAQHTRTISVSEAGRLFDCERQWDFSYGGRSLGTALAPKQPHLRLREGRAWGAGVAKWHETGNLPQAGAAIEATVAEDFQHLAEHGFGDPDERDELVSHLRALLADYVLGTQRLPLFDAERAFHVRIPSRTGRRRSSRYAFECRVDGLHRDDLDRLWIVEFKLRSRLSSFEQVAWSRQVRWYAWAVEQETGLPVAGVIVDERLNAEPKPVRILKSGDISHAKDQMCKPADYFEACAVGGVAINEETLAALESRRWQARHPVLLRREEITEAGLQLVSTAQKLAELDSGRRHPVPNPSPFRCPGCAFRDICGAADVDDLIDIEFERVLPKRSRPHEEVLTV